MLLSFFQGNQQYILTKFYLKKAHRSPSLGGPETGECLKARAILSHMRVCDFAELPSQTQGQTQQGR